MAKGASSKEIITQKILETFPNSFIYGKEVRIPLEEAGEQIQIKVTLTCAKTNVSPEGEEEPSISDDGAINFGQTVMNEPTEEEKQRVADLVQKLGL